MTRALYPGSFDPPTIGHVDLIGRAATLFGSLVVAVGENHRKASLFSLEERLEFLRRLTAGLGNVEVGSFSGLVVNYAAEQNVHVLVRGARNAADYQFEQQMALTNREIRPEVDTVVLAPSPHCAFVSSSLIKEVALNGGDASRWLPPIVATALREKLAQG